MKFLFLLAGLAISGAATAQGGNVRIDKQIPNELRATGDAEERKAEAEGRLSARLDAIDQEIADLKDLTEARAPDGELIDTAIANAEEQFAAAETALNEYKAADVADWDLYRQRAEAAFRQLDASMSRAQQEIMAH